MESTYFILTRTRAVDFLKIPDFLCQKMLEINSNIDYFIRLQDINLGRR